MSATLWAKLPLGSRVRYRVEAAGFFTLMGLFRILGLDCGSALGGFFGRQIGFLNSGVYRQTFLDNLGLIVAVWARKI